MRILPVFNEAPEKSVEILGGLIRHVHVKDSVKKDGKTIYRITGYGDVPIFDAVKALKEIGYEEFVCLEWVRLSAPELEDADIAFPQFAYYIKSLFSRI